MLVGRRPLVSCSFLLVVLVAFGAQRAQGFLHGRSHHGAPLLVVGTQPNTILVSFTKSTKNKRMMMAPVETFDYCLEHYQLATESTLSACLAVIGDTAAQLKTMYSVKKNSSNQAQGDEEAAGIDWKRTNAFFVKGAVAGVLWSRWYAFIDPIGIGMAQNLAPSEEWIESVRIVLSVCMDLFLFSPLLFCAWDLPFPMLARGDPIDSIPRKVRAKIAPILVDNTKVWMIPNLVIYSLPMQYRVVVTSCIDACWQMILSDQIAKPMVPPTELLLPVSSSSSSLDSLSSSSVGTEAIIRMENLAEQTQ